MTSIDGYLDEIRRGVRGMDPQIQRDILRELRSHLTESVAENGGNMSAAVAGLGDAAAVARRYRDLYGYGPAYRWLFAGIAGLLGIFTVPVLFAEDETVFPFFLSAVFLALAFVFLMWTSLAAGNRAALIAGVVALIGRVAGFGVAVALNRGASLITTEGVALFALVCALLIVVAWIPGKARETWRRPPAEL